MLILDFFIKKMDKRFDIENHPLYKPENLLLLYNLANRASKTADESFSAKNQVFVGMGQSPAYLLEMIKRIDRAREREGRSYMHVAFSGTSYMDGKLDPYLYRKYGELGGYYQQYLTKVGLSEADLNKDDTEFIILEVCHQGNGLRSFLSFFDNYKNSPAVIYLQSPAHFGPVCISETNERILINAQENNLTVALANADPFKDRLVPEFQFHRWKTVDPLAYKYEENAPKILKRIEQFVRDKN